MGIVGVDIMEMGGFEAILNVFTPLRLTTQPFPSPAPWQGDGKVEDVNEE